MSDKDAEFAGKIKSDFLASMSHELRTPLNAIIGYTEMVQEVANAAGQKESSENLDKVLGSARHLLELINDVLDVSKMAAGKMEVFLDEFPLNALVSELEVYINPVLKERKNTLKVSLNVDVNVMYSDVSRVRQSLLNLLTNANKFTKQGDITLDITSSVQNKIPMITFIVKDTGIGIKQEHLEKLFQSFSQGDPSLTRKYGGTGLGLYITKQFCEILGGDITVKSIEGVGSTFTMVLPLRTQSGTEQAKLKKSDKKENARGKVILIISNDPQKEYADTIKNIQEAGFTALCARSGEGLKVARQERPDVIALDVASKSVFEDSLMDDWATLCQLKADPELSTIPVVVMTKESEEVLGFKLEDVDFLTKPIDIRQLVNKVKSLVPKGEIPNLLIVDDNTYAREILAHAVKKMGWKAIEAENGKVAIEQLKKAQPSIILLDLMMPEMDGFAVINEMQKNEKWRNIPVIIISSKDLTKEERTMLSKYTTGILQKGSYTPKELMDAIVDQIK
jgi:CheY-like chemotaxis protein/anti-sigma regulatory factor (Ser/Thr protein kinase)